MFLAWRGGGGGGGGRNMRCASLDSFTFSRADFAKLERRLGRLLLQREKDAAAALVEARGRGDSVLLTHIKHWVWRGGHLFLSRIAILATYMRLLRVWA